VAISTTDRVAIFGRTGSGKTTLLKRLLNGTVFPGATPVPRFAVLDPKGRFTMSGVPVRKKFDEKEFDKLGGRVIYRSPIFGRDEMAWYDNLTMQLLRMGHVLIVNDEVSFVSKAYPTSPGLARALRTGRELGVGMINLTQKPTRIAGEILSESEHFVIFQLQYDRDRKKVIEFTGNAVGKEMDRLEDNALGLEHDAVYFNVKSRAIHRIHQPARVGKAVMTAAATA
jgi:DNA helicase HerA-like ATPase